MINNISRVAGVAGIALSAWLAATEAQAQVIHRDDFESPTSATTYWVETSDSNPTVPLVGQNWVVVESHAHSVQEVAHPQFLPGDPYPVFNPFVGAPTGPSFGSAPDGTNQYLHMWGSFSTVGSTSQAWIPISAADQALMATSGVVRLSVKVFGLSGHDFWRSGLRITGWDSPATTLTSPAFDVRLLDGGYGTNGIVSYRDGSGDHTVPGLVHTINTWQDLVIEANFSNDTFAISLDGVLAHGLTWAGGDLSKLQSVSLSLNDIASAAQRGGYDNVLLSIPEPSAMAMLGLGGLLLRRRSKNG